MRKYITILIAAFALFACDGKQANKPSETTTLADSLFLGAKELKEENKSERKLRYVFFANGGLIGYFNDGTTAGCPRCDLIEANIKSLYDQEPGAGYTVQSDGSLLTSDGERLHPKEVEESGFGEWAMIDYKWIVLPEGMEDANNGPLNFE